MPCAPMEEDSLFGTHDSDTASLSAPRYGDEASHSEHEVEDGSTIVETCLISINNCVPKSRKPPRAKKSSAQNLSSLSLLALTGPEPAEQCASEAGGCSPRHKAGLDIASVAEKEHEVDTFGFSSPQDALAQLDDELSADISASNAFVAYS